MADHTDLIQIKTTLFKITSRKAIDNFRKTVYNQIKSIERKENEMINLEYELYDQLNIKTLCETFVSYISEATSIVEILDILLDDLSIPETKSKYIKAIQSEYGTALETLSYLALNESQLKHNVLRVARLIDESIICNAALEIAGQARYRFLGNDLMLIISKNRDILQHPEATIRDKHEACHNIFTAAVIHGLKNPYLMPHIHAKNMISQSFIFRYDSEPRYSILKCFADNNETAALLAGDYYSNTQKLVEAASIYIQQSQSPTVMTDIGLFLSKNRKYLKEADQDGISYSEEDVVAAYKVMKAPLEKKIKPIIESNKKFGFLNDIKAEYKDLDMAFKILYIYAIRENDDIAANGALTMIIHNNVLLPNKERKAIMEELVSIAESKTNLMYLNGSTTGLVNDLVVRKTKKLPHTGTPEIELSDAEYAGLKENLEFLSAFFPKSRYNACRLRHQEAIDYKTEFDYEKELKLLKEIIENIPEEDSYHQHAIEFYREIGIEYHRGELKKLEKENFKKEFKLDL